MYMFNKKDTNIGIYVYVQEMYTYVNVRLLRLVVGSAQAGRQLFSSRLVRYVIFKYKLDGMIAFEMISFENIRLLFVVFLIMIF